MNVYEALAAMSQGKTVRRSDTGYVYTFVDIDNFIGPCCISRKDLKDGYVWIEGLDTFIYWNHSDKFYEVST